MTLANMREQGVHHLIAYCLNNACRHSALIDMLRTCTHKGGRWCPLLGEPDAPGRRE
jgi:hypothetical protein